MENDTTHWYSDMMHSTPDILTVRYTLSPGGHAPTKAHAGDAGWDVYAQDDEGLFTTIERIDPGQVMAIHTHLHVSIPDGYYGQLATRSSMAASRIIVVGGVIDSGYTGEVIVMLANIGKRFFYIEPGDKIAQLLILPVPLIAWQQTDALSESERGADGFGSSGK